MKTDPIQDYVLKSEHNLHIAAAVGEAWPKVRQKLVSGFLDRLELRLRQKLKSWEFGQYGQFFVDSDTGFYLLKPSWRDEYSIGLQFRDHGERNIIGVVRDTPDRGKRPHCEEVGTTFRKLYPSATTHPWWEARATLHSSAPDWRKPEVLWRYMKCRNDEFLQEVAVQLLAVVNVSAPIIDKLVRKYRSGHSNK